MSALWRGGAARGERAPVLAPMQVSDVDAVVVVERSCYTFPWSRGNFVDSLAAGYPAMVLRGAGGTLLGYFVAMHGVDEMHLLNITVAAAVEGRGHARRLFDALVGLCAENRAATLWLEVRTSNTRARAIYDHLGLAAVGMRKGYYPAPFGRREDALVMSLKLPVPPNGKPDALG